jgi:hypothetical protein
VFIKTTMLLMDCQRFGSISGSIFRTKSLGFKRKRRVGINTGSGEVS